VAAIAATVCPSAEAKNSAAAATTAASAASASHQAARSPLFDQASRGSANNAAINAPVAAKPSSLPRYQAGREIGSASASSSPLSFASRTTLAATCAATRNTAQARSSAAQTDACSAVASVIATRDRNPARPSAATTLAAASHGKALRRASVRT
jgi:hypothetical protein